MNFLSYQDTKDILTWHEAVDALRVGHQLPRAELHDVLSGPAEGMLLNRTARIEQLGYGIKAESIFSTNSSRGLPITHGAVLVYAADNGVLRGVIDSHIITDLKTAADSVLAATLLARPDSQHLVIMGAGRVAYHLAHAYSALFPQLEQISIWSRRPEQAETLVSQLGQLNPQITVVSDLVSTLKTADIVSTATMARQPILQREWIQAGTHIDLIGAFTGDMQEADAQLVVASKLYVDCHETTHHIGDIAIPIAEGMMTTDHIQGDLYDLVQRQQGQLRSSEDISMFENGGGAHLDLMIADRILVKMGL